MFYMFIGGSPVGTAGGIKTTTFAILILLVIAEIRGQSKIVIFKRSISRETSRKAFVIAFALLLTLLLGITLLTITENQTFLALCFEATSAIATVGLSMGITMQLTAAGKLIIIILMYLGRIGPLILILSLGTHRNNAKINDINYPDTTILIG